MRPVPRELVVLLLLAALYSVWEHRGRASDEEARRAAAEERHVVLVVADGLRWQEVFRGADSALVFGAPAALGGDGERVRRRWWRTSVAERRRELMPFLWSTMAGEGTLLGNRDVGNRVNVTNGKDFSYPGYNELLTGRPDPRIDRNDYGPNPNVTVFEWLARRDDFRGRVIAVGGWPTFADIFNVRRSGIPLHAARRDPIDAGTHAAALRILTERRPRALFVAHVETDDNAHAGRYDRTLAAAHELDAFLATLWSAVQRDPRYRGRTTLIVTADHGRGRTARDWMDHGADVPGAHEIFVAVLGPAVPSLGEVHGAPPLAQAQVAATVARAVGLEYRGVHGAAAPPIELVYRASSTSR